MVVPKVTIATILTDLDLAVQYRTAIISESYNMCVVCNGLRSEVIFTTATLVCLPDSRSKDGRSNH